MNKELPTNLKRKKKVYIRGRRDRSHWRNMEKDTI